MQGDGGAGYEEGLCIDVSTGGELAVALAAGVPGERLVLHGNNKSEAELEAADRGRRGPDRCRLVRRDRPPGPTAEPAGPVQGGSLGPPPSVLVQGDPGIEAHTHEYVMTGQEDSKFGFGLASGAAAEAIERLRHPTSCVRLVGMHAHIGSQIFALESFEQALAVLGPFFSDQGLEELCIGGGLGVPYVTGEAAPSITEWAKTLARSGTGRRHRRHRRALRRAGAVHRRCRSHHLLHGWHDQDPAGGPYLRQRGRRHERQPAARPLRLGLRGFPPEGSPGAAAPDRDHRGQALRIGRRARARRLRARRPRSRRRAGDARSPAPMATRWRPITTRCRGRRLCSCATASWRVVVRRETYSDLLALD